MMDAIVQLIRNGLCCIKDLEAFRDITLLWDPENTRYMLSTIILSMGGSGSGSGNSNNDDDVQPSLLDIPEPYNKTTPLEVLISIAQLYAVISLTISGYRMFMKNHTNYYRIRNLLLLVDINNNNNNMMNKNDDRCTNTTTVIQKTTTTTTTSSSSSQQEEEEEELVLNVSRRFVTESMINEGSLCIRNMMTGIFLFFLGISFIWLFGNSWHVTETPYMGGLRGLILALLMAEICLLPLVYYMYVDANHMMKQSKQILYLAKKMENTTTRTTTTKDSNSSHNNNNNKKDAIQLDDIIKELSSFEILSSWIPFWSSKYVAPAGSSKKDHLVDDDDKALMEAERVQVQEMLSILISQLTTTTTIDQKDDKTAAATTTTTTTSSSSASLVLLRKRLIAATNEYDEFVNDLLKRSNMIRYEGYREYLYLLCNAIAAYGYALGIIVYYYDKEHEHPYYIRSIVFHMNNQDAEWNGNFAGDLMWTIEPIIILLSPMIITYLMTTTNNNHSTIHRRKNIQKKSSRSEDEQQQNQDAKKKKKKKSE